MRATHWPMQPGLTKGDDTMGHQFLNAPDDCQWLRETHLRGVQGLPPFQSFVILGNEDSPDKVELYASADPLHTDPCARVDFTESSPVYCTVCQVQGGNHG